MKKRNDTDIPRMWIGSLSKADFYAVFPSNDKFLQKAAEILDCDCDPDIIFDELIKIEKIHKKKSAVFSQYYDIYKDKIK